MERIFSRYNNKHINPYQIHKTYKCNKPYDKVKSKDETIRNKPLRGKLQRKQL